jgi:hypothetical protein
LLLRRLSTHLTQPINQLMLLAALPLFWHRVCSQLQQPTADVGKLHCECSPGVLGVADSATTPLLLHLLPCRMLPLLVCYPSQDRAAALHQLLLHLVTSAAGSSSSSTSSSSSIKLAVALLEREAELLQMAGDQQAGAGRGAVAAIAKTQAAASTPTAAAAGRQQTSPPVSPLAGTPRSEQQQQQQGLPDGGLLWGGDVEACVTAVLAAVSACSSTNQWAKLEQMLDAAAEALAAAAAAAGQPLPASIASIRHRQQQQQQATGGRQSVSRQGRSTAAAAAAAGSANGWDDSWSDNDGDNSDDDYADAEDGTRNAQLTAAAAAVRAALAQHVLSEAAVHVLAADLAALRGRVRAARLLTKQGCCVGLGDLAAADGAAVNDMLQRLLGRAQR